jgi:hypothetical protein
MAQNWIWFENINKIYRRVARNEVFIVQIKNFKRVFEFGQKGIAQLEQKMEEDEAKWIGEVDNII